MTTTLLPEGLAEATLTVENLRNVPVTVFAEQGMTSVRLGEVGANNRETLRFPKSVITPVGSVQVFVHPRGGVDLATQSFRVQSGSHIGLRVPAP